MTEIKAGVAKAVHFFTHILGASCKV